MEPQKRVIPVAAVDLPLVFTEQGVAILASVLSSPRAVAVNIAIVRTFVRLRQIIESNQHLVEKLNSLEKKYDHQFKIVFDVIRKFMEHPASPHTQSPGPSLAERHVYKRQQIKEPGLPPKVRECSDHP